MATFDKIEAADFNRVQEKVANILGTGSASFGYGQALSSSPVTKFNKVSVAGWTNLQYDLITISRHQTGTIPTLPLPEEDTKIRFNSTTQPVNRFETFVAGLETNRFTINAPSLEITFFKSSDSGTISWKNNLQVEALITWDTVDQARYFFNMGGIIRCRSTKSEGTQNTNPNDIGFQNRSWEALVNDRNAEFKAQATTLASPLNNLSFYQCKETSSSPFYSLAGSGDYDQNVYNIYAWTPDTTDNRNGSARSLAIKFEYVDSHTPDGSATVDGVDGKMSALIQIVSPAGRRYPSNVNFSIPSNPTITFGTWTKDT